jgi:HK97 family phage major capsid protein
MTKLDMLKSLVEKATDKAELDKLNAEIVAVIREEEAEKLAKAAEVKAFEAERAAALAKTAGPVKGSGIEVGTPGLYKGRKMKMEMEALGEINPRWKDEKKAELITKHWLDAMESASMRAGVISKATVIGEDNTGAYLRAPEYSSEYLKYATEYSRALQICRVVPMNKDIQYIATELAKCSVALTAEGTDATATSATFAQTTLTAKRFDAYTAVSNELLDDINTPILPILIQQLTEAVGQKVDSAVFNGTGSPMSSVFSAAAGYSVVLGVGSSTFASVTAYSSFLDVIAKLASARQVKARWVAHRTPLWGNIYGVKDSAGSLMFQRETYLAGVGGPAGKIFGFPVTQLEAGNSTTAVSTAIAVFGDFDGVVIGNRQGAVDLFMDPYTQGKSNQTNIYMFTRWGFALALANNFVRLVTAGS